MKQVLRDQQTLVLPGLEGFNATMQRVFSARRVEIIAPETTEVRIAGKPDSVVGNNITIENISNPEKLNIRIEADKGDLSAKNGETLYLEKGTVSISGIKNFPPGDLLKSKKELELKPIPVLDPDLVVVDGKEFRQTGTVRITIAGGAHIRFV
jgi:hypothetical protein